MLDMVTNRATRFQVSGPGCPPLWSRTEALTFVSANAIWRTANVDAFFENSFFSAKPRSSKFSKLNSTNFQEASERASSDRTGSARIVGQRIRIRDAPRKHRQRLPV